MCATQLKKIPNSRVTLPVGEKTKFQQNSRQTELTRYHLLLHQGATTGRERHVQSALQNFFQFYVKLNIQKLFN